MFWERGERDNRCFEGGVERSATSWEGSVNERWRRLRERGEMGARAFGFLRGTQRGLEENESQRESTFPELEPRCLSTSRKTKDQDEKVSRRLAHVEYGI